MDNTAAQDQQFSLHNMTEHDNRPGSSQVTNVEVVDPPPTYDEAVQNSHQFPQTWWQTSYGQPQKYNQVKPFPEEPPCYVPYAMCVAGQQQLNITGDRNAVDQQTNREPPGQLHSNEGNVVAVASSSQMPKYVFLAVIVIAVAVILAIVVPISIVFGPSSKGICIHYYL